MAGIGLGLGLAFPRGASGPLAPPNTSDLIAYYEASIGTLDAGDAAADNFEKIKTWRDIAPVGDAHNLVQATAGNQLRVRKTTDIPLAYSSFKEESATLAMTATGLDSDNREIDQRASTFFALVEIDILVVVSVATERIIMSLPGGVGDLIAYTAVATPANAVLRWRDASGTTTTTIKLQSGLALVGVIFDAGEIRLFYNGQSATIATPLAAGTASSFTLWDGSLGTCIVGGFNCLGWYDHAIDSTELADLRTWAIVRKALSTTTRDLLVFGASNSLGCFANLNAYRRYAITRGDCSYRNFGFAGITTATTLNNLNAQIGVGSPANTTTTIHNTNNMQLLIIHCPTNDVTTGVAEATIIANLTAMRKNAQAYGVQVIFITMAPVGSFDAAMETKRQNINTAMEALDEREYGVCIPYPAEMTNPADTTYYDADGTHWNDTAHELLYDDIKATADSIITVTPAALQTHMEYNGNYRDSGIYKRDWEAVGTPSFVSGNWGRQALRCTTGGNYARGKNLSREFDPAGIYWSTMWWMRTSEAGNLNVWGKYTGGANTFLFSRHSGLTLRAFSNNIGTAISSSTYFNDGAWHCCAYSVDSDGIRLYGSADQYPANLTLQSFVAGTPVVGTTSARFMVASTGGASNNIDFQDLMMWFGSKTLVEFQAISVA